MNIEEEIYKYISLDEKERLIHLRRIMERYQFELPSKYYLVFVGFGIIFVGIFLFNYYILFSGLGLAFINVFFNHIKSQIRIKKSLISLDCYYSYLKKLIIKYGL